MGDPHDALADARSYVQASWPYWDRRGGRDHVFWAGNDQGICWGADAVRDSIRIVHYGRRDVFADHSGWLAPCAVEGRDVVATPHQHFLVAAARETYRLPPRERPARQHTLFFSGASAGHRGIEYSQGVRAEVTDLLAKEPGVFVPNATLRLDRATYAESMRSSKFCLAVSGYGYGMRIVEAMAYGCIPLILEENVAMPYADLLPYEAFSLLVRRADVAGVPALLAAFKPEQLRSLQEGVERHHRAFLWSLPKGAVGPGGGVPGNDGLAYEYTIRSLALRLAQKDLRDPGIRIHKKN